MKWHWQRIGWIAGGMGLLAGGALLLRPEPLAVEGVKLSSGRMQVTVEDIGETRSHDRFVLSAPVAGRMERISLHEGDAVQAKQLLARIAPVPLSERERTEILARIAAAQAAQRAVEQDVRQAGDGLAQARRELERWHALARDGFITPQALEQVVQNERLAVSRLEAAQARARVAVADVQLARAAMAVVQSSEQGGHGWLEIRAPMASRILRIHDPSERVVAIGAPLMSLGDVDHLEVVMPLLSTEAVKLRPGMPVLIEGWGGDEVLQAQVRQIESFAFTKVSALGVEEKRVNVIADFLTRPPTLGDGFRLKARIVTWSQDQVLTVPWSALFRCQAMWCVWRVEQGRIHPRTVTLGHRNWQEAEVLDGLAEGETVVRFPDNDLKEGARVRMR